MDILEFSEKVNVDLSSGWRVFLKLLYGLPHDPTARVRVRDWRGGPGFQLAEPEFVRYLRQMGWCNVMAPNPAGYPEAIASVGRQSGKTTVSTLIEAYEFSQLATQLENPQTRYGLPPSNTISILHLGTDQDQAGLAYQLTHDLLGLSGVRLGNATKAYVRAQTRFDTDETGLHGHDPRARQTLKMAYRTAQAKGLRGLANKVVVLDEGGHYSVDPAELRTQLLPSTYPFKAKGREEYKFLTISSPSEQLQRLWESTAKQPDSLAWRAPSWLMTARALPYKQHYDRDAAQFAVEFGAEWPTPKLPRLAGLPGRLLGRADRMLCQHCTGQWAVEDAPKDRQVWWCPWCGTRQQVLARVA